MKNSAVALAAISAILLKAGRDLAIEAARRFRDS